MNLQDRYNSLEKSYKGLKEDNSRLRTQVNNLMNAELKTALQIEQIQKALEEEIPGLTYSSEYKPNSKQVIFNILEKSRGIAKLCDTIDQYGLTEEQIKKSLELNINFSKPRHKITNLMKQPIPNGDEIYNGDFNYGYGEDDEIRQSVNEKVNRYKLHREVNPRSGKSEIYLGG